MGVVGNLTAVSISHDWCEGAIGVLWVMEVQKL